MSYGSKKKDPKIEFQVSLAYEHRGPEADFPLRLRIGLGSGFVTGGESDAEFLVSSPSELVESGFPLAADGAGRAFGIFETRLRGRLSSGEKKTDRLLPPKGAVVLNVCCSIVGDYGKPMWRDGGTCHFLLSECLSNETEAPHVFKTVSKSAYGVAKEDRLSGWAGLMVKTEGGWILSRKDVAARIPLADCDALFVSSQQFRPLGEKHESLRRHVDGEFSAYREILRCQDELVPRDDKTTNMRCPWTPMDACVWELFEDEYGTSEDGKPIGAKNSVVLTSVARSSEIGTNSGVASSAFSELADALFSVCRGKNGTARAPRDLSGTASGTRVYLPFFAYCITRPLAVCRSHWTRALEIYVARKGVSPAEYVAYFFDPSTSESERAAEAAGMISMYAQALEYVSDYVVPMSAGGSRNGGRRRRTGAPEDDGRKEVEQFWDALIALCGDCDDLTLAHLQMYKAFVMDSWKTEKTNDSVRANSVLRRMRSVLANNYVPMFNIEAVYLPKQSSSGSRSREAVMAGNPFRLASDGSGPERPSKEFFNPSGYLGFSSEFADGDYDTDAGSVNSAHAALKLLPKKYFERCVDRAYARAGSPGPFSAKENAERRHGRCCFYHAHPPDDFNDDLPVLFLEGTSMLFCHDGRGDPCSAKVFAEVFLDDPLLGEVGKFPIYARRAESAFYGSSLFGATLDFLDNHGVATFSYARIDPNAKEGKRGLEFSRGASHRQLSLKSENVVILPYGADLFDRGSSEPRAVSENTETAEEGSKPCRRLRFRSTEVSPFMRHLCYEECKNRPAARKLRNPRKTSREPKGANGRDTFDPNRQEDRRPSEENGKLLQAWCDAANSNATGPDGTERPTVPKGYFCYFVNNYYVDREFVERLSEVCAVATEEQRKKVPGESFYYKVQTALEEHSTDVKIWRIRWDFY